MALFYKIKYISSFSVTMSCAVLGNIFREINLIEFWMFSTLIISFRHTKQSINVGKRSHLKTRDSTLTGQMLGVCFETLSSPETDAPRSADSVRDAWFLGFSSFLWRDFAAAVPSCEGRLRRRQQRCLARSPPRISPNRRPSTTNTWVFSFFQLAIASRNCIFILGSGFRVLSALDWV